MADGLLVSKNLIVGEGGNFIFSVVEDNTEHAKDVAYDRERTRGWTEERSMKKMVSVPPYVYYTFTDKLGADCWSDQAFLKFFKKQYPHYSY